jgi:hypothetical protein
MLPSLEGDYKVSQDCILFIHRVSFQRRKVVTGKRCLCKNPIRSGTRHAVFPQILQCFNHKDNHSKTRLLIKQMDWTNQTWEVGWNATQFSVKMSLSP